MDKRVLLVAFHYPPWQGSSGLQRTLRFSQHLAQFGWQPVVLSIDPVAYENRSATIGNEVPEGVEVVRAFGLDTARHLSLFGRYPRSLAVPDRWATWRFRAVPVACKLVRQRNIRAIWSTFPIATAHSIGLEVARQTGLPWLAEFRDPMWQGDYPPDPQVNRAWQAMEHEIFLKASRVVVTTPSAARLYAERFAEHKAKVAVIENGYDEETFARAEADFSVPNTRHGPFVLLHSGVIYPSERDPTQFFAALAALKRRGVLSAQDLRVVLRATGNDQQFRTQLEALDIVDIVRLEPSVSYLDALREMLSVDALLIMQAANCNAQIPAKLYEYLRAGRPILALTDPAGDTAGALQAAGAGTLARLDSQEEIERTLPEFLRRVRDDSWERAGTDAVQRYSRRSQTGQLARLLDAAIG